MEQIENSFLKRLAKSFDFSIAFQSAPSLIISLAGLLLTGYLFEISIKNGNLQLFPIILESSCILSFKGNIELSFAMHLSSAYSNPRYSLNYKEYAFQNSCILISQSFAVGLFVGIIGILNSCINRIIDNALFIRICVSTLFTCTFSSMAFITILLIAIKVSYCFNLDMENIILPIASSLNDLLIVQGLILSSEFQLKLTPNESLFLAFLIFALVCFCLFISFNTKERIPNQALKVLFTTCTLSMMSGYLLETYSRSFPFLAPSFPVFSGMCGSISYIDIHRRFKNISLSTVRLIPSYPTLTCVSLFVSVFYMVVSFMIGIDYTAIFSALFILAFCTQVLILLVIIEYLFIFSDQNPGKSIHINMLPIVSSISDFLSSVTLISIASFVSYIMSD